MSESVILIMGKGGIKKLSNLIAQKFIQYEDNCGIHIFSAGNKLYLEYSYNYHDRELALSVAIAICKVCPVLRGGWTSSFTEAYDTFKKYKPFNFEIKMKRRYIKEYGNFVSTNKKEEETVKSIIEIYQKDIADMKLERIKMKTFSNKVIQEFVEKSNP